MLKPSIDSLLDRVNSKYSLVILEEIEAEMVVNDPHPEIKRARLKMEQEERKALKDQEQKELEARIRDEQKL